MKLDFPIYLNISSCRAIVIFNIIYLFYFPSGQHPQFCIFVSSFLEYLETPCFASLSAPVLVSPRCIQLKGESKSFWILLWSSISASTQPNSKRSKVSFEICSEDFKTVLTFDILPSIEAKIFEVEDTRGHFQYPHFCVILSPFSW